MTFTLPNLPYAHDALAPHMSKETLEFHHDKHHQAYVTNGNNAIKGTEFEGKSLEEIVKGSFGKNPAVFNNAGQHYNHLHFWNWMKPNGGGSKLPGRLEKKITEDLGGLEKFKTDFAAAGVGQFGSGWCWLSVKNGKLEISKTANGESPLVHGATPILGCDVWEHSYYIDYRNRRPDYLKAFCRSPGQLGLCRRAVRQGRRLTHSDRVREISERFVSSPGAAGSVRMNANRGGVKVFRIDSARVERSPRRASHCATLHVSRPAPSGAGEAEAGADFCTSPIGEIAAMSYLLGLCRWRPRRDAAPSRSISPAPAVIGTGFPWGTFIINITGSTVMGLIAGYLAFKGEASQPWRLFLMTGILGGYTTFSAFSLDAALLYERGELGLRGALRPRLGRALDRRPVRRPRAGPPAHLNAPLGRRDGFAWACLRCAWVSGQLPFASPPWRD